MWKSNLGLVNLDRFDHINQLITLSLITLSGAHCNIIVCSICWQFNEAEQITKFQVILLSHAERRRHPATLERIDLDGSLQKRNNFRNDSRLRLQKQNRFEKVPAEIIVKFLSDFTLHNYWCWNNKDSHRGLKRGMMSGWLTHSLTN